MWSFLLGSATGIFALHNGPLLRRAFAWMVVKSEDGIETVGKHVRRTGARIVEDAQDIIAEAAAELAAQRLRESGQQAIPHGPKLDVN